MPQTLRQEVLPNVMPTFEAPYDWPTIDEAVLQRGAAVVRGLVARDQVDAFNDELDAWLTDNGVEGPSQTGSRRYDRFLGRRTLRVQGLPAKVPAIHPLITHPEIVGWAQRMLATWCSQILLSVAEMIQIGPREVAQPIHKDIGSWWPHIPMTEHPLNVHAMIAMSRFTKHNGATRVLLDSTQLPLDRNLDTTKLLQAEMAPGDVLMFRGDTVHAGGANRTDDESRRALGLSYCVGWLRQVENYFLSVPPAMAKDLPDDLLALLGYVPHDATPVDGGLVGMYDNADPLAALRSGRLT